MARNFKAEKPNEKWFTDVTGFSIPSDKRKLYLSPIMDFYGSGIIEYKLSFKNNNQIVFKIFDSTLENYPDVKPIFYRDRGVQV
ncbi:DDE-type integrase/transposase/recombinase [Wukongibacter sp. M2B1]|uniref:DDE-type integrase/transposase/recombinase n=1 Tax=Wukongibacter sp. M2B1 TaxID=3088895 RepID=UPI003D7931A3